MDKKLQKGRELINKIHGHHTGQTLIDEIMEISPTMAKMAIEWVYGDIYQDKTLDLKTRELTIISCLVAQNAHNELKAHMEAARTVGVSKDEIISLIQQLAMYVGFPVAINAMLIAKEVFNNESK